MWHATPTELHHSNLMEQDWLIVNLDKREYLCKNKGYELGELFWKGSGKTFWGEMATIIDLLVKRSGLPLHYAQSCLQKTQVRNAISFK